MERLMKPTSQFKVLCLSLGLFSVEAYSSNYELLTFACEQKEDAESKIVGMVQMRNEALIIEQCLRGLAQYTDSIVVLDDASEDQSVEIVKSLADELKIERIICNKKSGWEHSTEMDLRDLLIHTARSIGATHFIQLDADELLSARCMKNKWLKRKILSLKKGQVLNLPMIHPWKSIHYYRNDRS